MCSMPQACQSKRLLCCSAILPACKPSRCRSSWFVPIASAKRRISSSYESYSVQGKKKWFILLHFKISCWHLNRCRPAIVKSLQSLRPENLNPLVISAHSLWLLSITAMAATVFKKVSVITAVSISPSSKEGFTSRPFGIHFRHFAPPKYIHISKSWSTYP